ncbi:MAG: NUDIX domain-containing protein [Balneolales bacterium]
MADHLYSQKVRVRVNGLLVEEGKLLLVKIRHPTREVGIWMPPGGGIDFGEKMEDAVRREILEETGVKVQVGDLRYIHEYIQPPLHAVEFYYDCYRIGGTAGLGHDPELPETKQLLEEVCFVPLTEIAELPVVPEHIRWHFKEEHERNERFPKIISNKNLF